MAEDKDTRVRLLESAKQEFLEKGYAKASLRTICKNAGVTTGALYFFFQDKNHLFAEIVDEPLRELREILMAHMAEDEKIMTSDNWLHLHSDLHEQVDEGLELAVVHHLYAHYDIFILLLTGAQGSSYETCADDMVAMLEKSYQNIISMMIQKNPKLQTNEYMLHWLAHMNIDAFVHLLTHERDEQKALEHAKKVLHYIISGWMELIVY
ncbi:MAG: TetR/AcrR family transcriptional regulator [bacterium]|nr:TetR/AcrR family transcriptional regulator [bacterium]